jgi:hypothetical protein
LILSVAASARGAAEPAAACPPHAPPRAGAVGPLFELLRLDGLTRMRAEFSEEKHIALLARPLRSTGTLYFDRARGIARVAATPRAERVVLSQAALRIERGDRVEEIPLDKSRALRAFALVFPALLRGERQTLEATFDLELSGSARAAWSLALVPRDPALCGLIQRVVVSGHGADVAALQVVEASGDTTDTALAGIARNEAVPAAEIAKAFGQGLGGP